MSSIENISPAVIKRISKELSEINADPPEGVRVIINHADICDIQAWILGPECTPYEGGCFKVKLVLGAEFPAVPPKCFFITKMFHPNVSKVGEVCVNTLKKDWKKDLGVKHILLTVKCLLIAPNAESALNEEAGKLLLENYDDYAKHARLLTRIHAYNIAPVFTQSNANQSPIAATSNVKKIESDNKINVKSEDGLAHAVMSPLADSHHMNETKSSANPKKSGPSTVSHQSSTVTPKKRAADKKSDKKPVDKKRSLKRL